MCSMTPFILSATSTIQSSFSLRRFLRSYSLHQSFQAGTYKNKVGIYNYFDPRHMALSIRLPLFDHVSNILTNAKLTELLITQLSFGQRVLLDLLFPHSFQLPPYLAVRDQVSHSRRL
jgi:hypothetical protein